MSTIFMSKHAMINVTLFKYTLDLGTIPPHCKTLCMLIKITVIEIISLVIKN